MGGRGPGAGAFRRLLVRLASSEPLPPRPAAADAMGRPPCVGTLRPGPRTRTSCNHQVGTESPGEDLLHLDDALVAPIRFAEKRTPIDLDGRSPDETPFPSLLKRGPRCSDQSRTATHATLLTDSVNEMLS